MSRPKIYELGDTKYLVLDEEASMKKQHPNEAERNQHYKELEDCIKQPGFYEALRRYFMSIDLTGFDSNKIPFDHDLIKLSSQGVEVNDVNVK
jgi:hypothetical protein